MRVHSVIHERPSMSPDVADGQVSPYLSGPAITSERRNCEHGERAHQQSPD
jgi:hypothetical protein